MIKPDIKKKLMEDMNKLSDDQQQKVQDFAHALLISRPGGTSGKDLVKFAGILNNEEAIQRIYSYLNKSGIQKKLVEKGASEGDELHIGNKILMFRP